MKPRNLILLVAGLIGACVCGAICTSVLGLGAFGFLPNETMTPIATAASTQSATTPTSAATAINVEPTAIAATPTRSIQRQNTPPVIVPATPTATLTPRPTATPTEAPPTETPVPPPPPPTNTPRPAPVQYRLDVDVHDGYEDWGQAQNCQNYNPAVKSWKLSIDITFYNDSLRVIESEAWYPNFFDSAGNRLLTCYYPISENDRAFPAVPAKDKRKMTFFVHSAQNQFVSEMRIQIGSTVLRRCFARNKRADVVGCG